jgi:hypothetical protein
MSPAQIAVEHEAALASLTPQQLRALDRLREASQQTNFNGKFPKENLEAIFRREAYVRSEREAGTA